MQTPPQIFDRRQVRLNRAKSALARVHRTGVQGHAGDQLIDRLRDVTRSFNSALACGVDTGRTGHLLSAEHGIESVYCGEFRDPRHPAKIENPPALRHVTYDDEWVPFKDGAFDLVVNVLSMHWVNDLPGALIQLRRCLQADGLFLATMFGGQTLFELRECLLEAETVLKGGAAPRVSPFVDVRDAGNLLVRAGFALPVADTDIVTQDYKSLGSLFADLRSMGEANAVSERPRGLTTPRLFNLAESIYRERYPAENGHLRATFELVTLTAWSPAETQQKPLAPGAAMHRLSDALNTEEKPL